MGHTSRGGQASDQDSSRPGRHPNIPSRRVVERRSAACHTTRVVVGGLLGLLLRDHIVQHVECGIEPLLATGTDDDERPVTIEINVTYLEAGEPGVLRTVANIRRRGSRFTVLEAEVLQDDRLIAFATGDPR